MIVEQNHNRQFRHDGSSNCIYTRFQCYVHRMSPMHVTLEAGVNVFNLIDSLVEMTDL